MSEYVLKIENEQKAEALLTYLRSLDYVELLPKQSPDSTKQKAVNDMKSFLTGLPNRADYTQQEVNQALNELRAAQHDR